MKVQEYEDIKNKLENKFGYGIVWIECDKAFYNEDDFETVDGIYILTNTYFNYLITIKIQNEQKEITKSSDYKDESIDNIDKAIEDLTLVNEVVEFIKMRLVEVEEWKQ